MKHHKIPTLTVLLLALTACVDSIGPVEAPTVAKVPDKFRATCADPVVLPDRPTTQFETETGWAEDRSNLRLCKDLKDEFTAWVLERDTGLRNGH